MLSLHVFNVLLPELQYARDMQGSKPGRCRVVETRIEYATSPIGSPKYILQIRAARVVGNTVLEPVWVERAAGDFSPSRSDAETLAKRYPPGSEHACWYDPDDPGEIVLGRHFGWWPWPVALIPLSLLAVGIWGIVASLMQVATSAERRSLVAVRASRLDPLRESSTRQSAALPAYDSDVESPGVRFAHRLPTAGSAAWRMVGLFFVCAVWNALLAYFLYVVSIQQLADDSLWLALGLVVVLGLVGVWLAFHLVRELWERRGIGLTQVEISDTPLKLGGQYQAFLMQHGQMKLKSFSVRLVCEEVASFEQGTNSQVDVVPAYVVELRKWRGIEVERGLPFEAEFGVDIPATAMHSFRSPHNQIRWLIEVEGMTQRQQELVRRFPFSVVPHPVTPPLDQQLARDLARGVSS